MNHGDIFFEIHVDDVDRAVKFYQSVFGWAMSRNPGVPIEYYDIETGGSRGGLLQRPMKAPAPGQGTNALICSLEVNNFDATAAMILSNGGQVALEKFPVVADVGRDILSIPKAMWEILATIKENVPEAEEHISYNMPAFKVNGA
jgi:predicted enzyme related to lactoylglutathione lyase